MNTDANSCTEARYGHLGLREIRILAWLYAGVSGSGFLVDLLLGSPPDSAVERIGEFGRLCAMTAGLALLIFAYAERTMAAKWLCRAIAVGHVAFALTYAGLYEGGWLGYGEIGHQLILALVFATAAWVLNDSSMQDASRFG